MSSPSPPPELSASHLIRSRISYEKYNQYNRIHLRVLIPRIYSGRIIGKQGKTITGIRNYYHIFMHSSNCESQRHFMRLFDMKGRPEDCAMACTNCFELLAQSSNDPILNGMSFVLPDMFITYLKEGGKKQNRENIFQAIAEQTNTEIRIMSNCLPNSTERIVRISIPTNGADGLHKTVQKFYQGVKLLTQQLNENITLAMCAPDNLFYKQDAEEDLVFLDAGLPPDQYEEVYYCEV